MLPTSIQIDFYSLFEVQYKYCPYGLYSKYVLSDQ